jgi:hypothetical protein
LTNIGNVLTYTDTGLTNGRTYFYRIYAMNEIGQGVPSSTIELTPESDYVEPDNVDNGPGNGSWSWTSSAATFITFSVAIVIAFLYFRKPKEE